jgi:hypothetical protein
VIVEPIEEKTEQLIPVPEPVKVNEFILSEGGYVHYLFKLFLPAVTGLEEGGRRSASCGIDTNRHVG